MVELVSRLEVEGTVFIRSNARYILALAAEKFKMKIKRRKGQQHFGWGGGRADSDSDGDGDVDSDSKSDSADDEEDSTGEDEVLKRVKYMPNATLGYTLNKMDIAYTGSSNFPTLFINKKMSSGVYNLKVKFTQYLMVGLSDPGSIPSIQVSYFRSHNALYITSNSTAQFSPSAQGIVQGASFTPATVIAAEVNMADRTLFFFFDRKVHTHYLINIPNTCHFGICKLGGAGTVNFISLTKKAEPSVSKKEKKKLTGVSW